MKDGRKFFAQGLILWLGLITLMGLGMDGIVMATAQAEAGATRVVTDHLDRQVEVPVHPQRILALTRNFMEELFELGVTPVGKVEEYKNRPQGVALPSVSKQSTPNLEVIYQLKPDLIFANTRQHGPMLDSLSASGAAVIFIDPSRVDNDPMLDRIEMMADILNRREAAEAYIERLEAVSRELRDKIASYGYRTGLMLEGAGSTGKAAQPTGFYGALFTRLGIENIIPSGLPGSDQSTWVVFDVETIMATPPDLILLRASTNHSQEHQKLRAEFMGNPLWRELKAVKAGKVFVLPARIGPGNIRNEDALRLTAGIIRGETVAIDGSGPGRKDKQ